jgi:hypothetical protein
MGSWEVLIMEMTNRERLTAIFNDQETDRFSWSPLVDDYFTGSLPEMGYPEMNSIEFGKLIGYDILERHVNPYIWNYNDRVNVRYESRENENRSIFETPVGSISSIFKSSRRGGGITKFPVVTLEDMKVYLYILENSIADRDFERFVRTEAIIGDSGIATASIYETGTANMISRMMGLENMIFAMCDYPDEFDELVWAFHEFNKKLLHITCESPAQLIFSYEGTSTTVISDKIYRKYSLPQTDEYADIVHSYGKKFIIHMCGKLAGFKDIIKKGRQDGIDSLCPPTTGDVELCEALDYFPGKLIIGGIEPSALERMSVSETENYVIDILEQCKFSNKFILSTGDATPYGTPVENIRKVQDIVDNYKV